MLVGFDIDGTLDADPSVFLSLMQALKAAGHVVAVLTGYSLPEVTPEAVEQKEEYLRNLGLGEAYDQLAVFGEPPHEAKAEWLKTHNASLLIDNSKKNAKLSPCTVLVPWQTRTD